MADKKLHSLFSPSLPNFTFPHSPNMELIIALFFHVLNFHLFFPEPSAELKKAKKTFSVSVSTEPCLSGTTQPPVLLLCSLYLAMSLPSPSHSLHLSPFLHPDFFPGFSSLALWNTFCRCLFRECAWIQTLRSCIFKTVLVIVRTRYPS